MTEEKKEKLIDLVIIQIKEDVIMFEDVTAIEEMLKMCPEDVLIDYLPEDCWSEFRDVS